jgi:transposase
MTDPTPPHRRSPMEHESVGVVTLVRLEAPKRLRGRMPRHTPARLREERLAWVAARRAEGHSMRAIAKALGLTSGNALLNTCARNGLDAKDPMRGRRSVYRSRDGQVRLSRAKWGLVRVKDFTDDELAEIENRLFAFSRDGSARVSDMFLHVLRGWLREPPARFDQLSGRG